jgi:hypothetical protein
MYVSQSSHCFCFTNFCSQLKEAVKKIIEENKDNFFANGSFVRLEFSRVLIIHRNSCHLGG